MLIIAHRLSTIIHCDRVLVNNDLTFAEQQVLLFQKKLWINFLINLSLKVLNEGEVAEFDSPHILLQGNGYFSKLVAELSIEESKSLRIQAEYYYNNPEATKGMDQDFIKNTDIPKDISFKGYRRKVSKILYTILCPL